MKKLIPFIILFLLFISCHKKIITQNSDYEGHWEGEEGSQLYTIDIDAQSHFSYYAHYRGGGTTGSISGSARLGKTHIIVGIHRFHIMQPPTKIDTTQSPHAQWQMRIISPVFYGGYGVTYYKQ